jgi:hypothetical protein
MSNSAAPATNVAAIIDGIISSAVVIFFEPGFELFIPILLNLNKSAVIFKDFCDEV